MVETDFFFKLWVFYWLKFPKINLTVSLCCVSNLAIPKYMYQSILLTLCLTWPASRLHPHHSFTTGEKPKREVCRWKGMEKFPNNLFHSDQALIPCPPTTTLGTLLSWCIVALLAKHKLLGLKNYGWILSFGSVTCLGKIKSSSHFIRMNSPIPNIELARYFLQL